MISFIILYHDNLLRKSSHKCSVNHIVVLKAAARQYELFSPIIITPYANILLTMPDSAVWPLCFYCRLTLTIKLVFVCALNL